jgi:hypothetical protein
MKRDFERPLKARVVTGMGRSNYSPAGDTVVLYKQSSEQVQAQRDPRTVRTLESEK